MGLLDYMLNFYENIEAIPQEFKPFYTDTDMLSNSQIRFPCIFCKRIILDYQTSFSNISSYEVEGRMEFYHQICKPKGFRLSDISEYMPLYSKPQNKPKKLSVSAQSLQFYPSSDKKREDFDVILLALQEYPRTKPLLHKDTNIDKLTIGWRIWDNHINTEEFNQKSGKIQRLSETFCIIGTAPRGVHVIGLVNYPYPKKAIEFCKNKLKYTFNERLVIAEG